MNALRFIRDFLLGCTHPRNSFPQTRKGQTYIACLLCGKERAYDWQRMKVTHKFAGGVSPAPGAVEANIPAEISRPQERGISPAKNHQPHAACVR